MQKIEVSEEVIQDAINIVDGVYAPIDGFLYSNDFYSVLEDMRLSNGSVWSIPIILDIDKGKASKVKDEVSVEIYNREKGNATLEDIEVYNFDKNEFALKVFGTLDESHPGVREIMNMGDYLIGAKVREVKQNKKVFPEYNFTPKEVRQQIKKKGWQKVVAFQTRNVPHLGHEFLQRYALESADGIFIQPVIGRKKPYDFNDECIVSAYESLINRHHGNDRAVLGVLPLKMRYAGPREALMHALIRRNFGCTHFIVGRDHAGVGNFYHPTEAQDIFDKFSSRELGIEVIKLGEVVFDKAKKKHCFDNECAEENKIKFSGTKLRKCIKNKEVPPDHLIRKDIFEEIINHPNPLIDDF